MGVERTQTAICPGCWQIKGLRANGVMATHSVGVGESRHKCFGVGQKPVEKENDNE